MKNIFLICLVFFTSYLKSQDDVYYTESDTIYKKEKKYVKLKYRPNYQNSLYKHRNIRRNFYYTHRVSPFYAPVENIPYHIYYYNDIYYNPLRNDYWFTTPNSNPYNSFDENNDNNKPRTTEKIYNNTTKRTPINNDKPNTSGRKF